MILRGNEEKFLKVYLSTHVNGVFLLSNDFNIKPNYYWLIKNEENFGPSASIEGGPFGTKP